MDLTLLWLSFICPAICVSCAFSSVARVFICVSSVALFARLLECLRGGTLFNIRIPEKRAQAPASIPSGVPEMTHHVCSERSHIHA
jgi:hypothetical protein